MDGQNGGMDDRQKVITIAHAEHSSGELKRYTRGQNLPACLIFLSFIFLSFFFFILFVCMTGNNFSIMLGWCLDGGN